MAHGTCAACGDEGNLKRGWCASKCYKRWYRTGDPLKVTLLVGVDDETRFWSHVNKSGPVPAHAPGLGPCWLWSAGRDDSGYGIFNYHDETGRPRKTRAHRWLLGHVRGRPLSREVVGEEDACHHCDNPPCVNPGHLYVGTRKQNVGDAVARKRLWQQKVTHCPQGHEYPDDPSAARRRCRECENTAQRAARIARKTECRNGHPLEGGNLLVVKNGRRKCRACEEDRIAKFRAAKAARTECPNGHAYTPENTGTGTRGNRFCKECQRVSAAARRRAA